MSKPISFLKTVSKPVLNFSFLRSGNLNPLSLGKFPALKRTMSLSRVNNIHPNLTMDRYLQNSGYKPHDEKPTILFLSISGIKLRTEDQLDDKLSNHSLVIFDDKKGQKFLFDVSGNTYSNKEINPEKYLSGYSAIKNQVKRIFDIPDENSNSVQITKAPSICAYASIETVDKALYKCKDFEKDEKISELFKFLNSDEIMLDDKDDTILLDSIQSEEEKFDLKNQMVDKIRNLSCAKKLLEFSKTQEEEKDKSLKKPSANNVGVEDFKAISRSENELTQKTI